MKAIVWLVARVIVGVIAVGLLAAGGYWLWSTAPGENRVFEFIVAVGVLGTFFIAMLAPTAASTGRLRRAIRWKQVEYDKLGSLGAGISVRQIETTLGAPVFEWVSKDGSLRESIFRGKSYWVQAVYDAITNTVKFLAITSTSLDFRPTFTTPLGTITLHESRFSSANVKPYRIRYFTRGATAPSYYFDDYYLGNPGFYKAYTLGVNEVGAFDSEYLRDLPGPSPFMSTTYVDLPFPGTDPNVLAFRDGSNVNTYGETDVFFDLERIVEGFTIGPDPIRIRTIR